MAAVEKAITSPVEPELGVSTENQHVFKQNPQGAYGKMLVLMCLMLFWVLLAQYLILIISKFDIESNDTNLTRRIDPRHSEAHQT